MRNTETVCGEQDNNEGFVVLCSDACSFAFGGSRQENDSGISKVCYPRCIRTMDRLASGRD